MLVFCRIVGSGTSDDPYRPDTKGEAFGVVDGRRGYRMQGGRLVHSWILCELPKGELPEGGVPIERRHELVPDEPLYYLDDQVRKGVKLQERLYGR